jgi:HAMP domain-containing protein
MITFITILFILLVLLAILSIILMFWWSRYYSSIRRLDRIRINRVRTVSID